MTNEKGNSEYRDVGLRVTEFRKSKKIRQIDLAEATGLARSYIGNVENGNQDPSFNFIMSLIKAFPSLNPQWLLTGRGLMEWRPSAGPGSLDSDMAREAVRYIAETTARTSDRIDFDPAQFADAFVELFDHYLTEQTPADNVVQFQMRRIQK